MPLIYLVSWNHKGLLPLEQETEAAFLQRAALLEQPHASTTNIEASLAYCDQLFDVRPDWVRVTEQQQGLSPWQGAVTWIQEAPDHTLIPLIQISPRMQGSVFQKWYSREEILAHELIHAVRLPLKSSRFEECIAYQTSRSKWRKWLGPILRHPYEVYVLLAALLIGWVGMFWDAVSFLVWAPWAVSLFGLLRLSHTHRVFKRCLEQLKKLDHLSLPIAARLTDREIELFARSSVQSIRAYIAEQSKTELRWQMLCAAYPALALGSGSDMQ